MKTSFLILLNKLITKICHLFKRDGSVFPASLVIPLDKDILSKIKYPKYVIGVTGSSGKGSTTSLIAHILENSNLKVVWNKSGSNVVNGTTTLILNNSSFFTHKLKADVLLLEMDESYIKSTFKNSTLTHLVITNITRDQPARNAEPKIVLNKILNSIDEKTTLVIDADDSLVNYCKYVHKGKVVCYGIDKTKESIDKPISNNVDGAYCPLCHEKLIYDYYHYGHIGSYKCKNNDFVRSLDFEAKKVDIDGQKFIVDNNEIKINKNSFTALYYTLAAYSLCKTIGINDKDILRNLNDNMCESKRMKSIKFDNRYVEMIESKNENNLSYIQSLKYINKYNDKKAIILGFDNVSRRYSYNDLSWLYDVDFNILDTTNIEKIFCIGRFRFDVYNRLINSGIDKDKIFMVDNIKLIPKYLRENSIGKIFTMVCFDMTAILKKVLMEAQNYDN